MVQCLESHSRLKLQMPPAWVCKTEFNTKFLREQHSLQSTAQQALVLQRWSNQIDPPRETFSAAMTWHHRNTGRPNDECIAIVANSLPSKACYWSSSVGMECFDQNNVRCYCTSTKRFSGSPISTWTSFFACQFAYQRFNGQSRKQFKCLLSLRLEIYL